MSDWTEHRFRVPDLEMAFYVRGSGEPVVFLSGGPGDSSRYLRDVAMPLCDQFTCVLLDQRGTGASRLEVQNPVTLHVERFVEDLEALRVHLGLERLALIGHSWGANLALIYAARHAKCASSVALIAPGPINAAMSAVAGENSLRGFTQADLEARAEFRARRKAASQANDLEQLRALHLESVARFWSRNAIHNEAIRARFVTAFDASEFNPRVHALAYDSVPWDALEPTYSGVTARTLIVYGFQDFEPITQAFRLRDLIPQARLEFLNACGHIPWLEQPKAFYAVLNDFLGS